MKAIILAAGKSSRLANINQGLPKACIKLNSEESLIDRTINLLLKNNFSKITIILGFAADEARSLIKKKWQKDLDKLKFLINDDFENKDNIYSVYLCRDLLDDETFLFNSDLVFDEKILQLALDKKSHSEKSFLIVDDHKTLVDEDMKIALQNQHIIRVSKSLDNDSANGEYIGLMYINNHDAKIYGQELESLIKCNDVKRHYEYALDRILKKIDLDLVSTQGLSWAEVDTEVDLEKAKSLACIKALSQSKL